MVLIIVFHEPLYCHMQPLIFLCPHIEKSGVYCFTIVCLSIRPSVYTSLKWKLNISLLLLNLFS